MQVQETRCPAQAGAQPFCLPSLIGATQPRMRPSFPSREKNYRRSYILAGKNIAVACPVFPQSPAVAVFPAAAPLRCAQDRSAEFSKRMAGAWPTPQSPSRVNQRVDRIGWWEKRRLSSSDGLLSKRENAAHPFFPAQREWNPGNVYLFFPVPVAYPLMVFRASSSVS